MRPGGGHAAAPEILTAAYYEKLEELERRHWWCRSVRRVALELVAPELSPEAVVLDAGCGAGGLLAVLGQRRPSAQLVGADISADALGLARSKGLRGLLLASAAELPVAPGSVDVVFANDVLQHLPEGEDARALSEARRVLRPAGLLCLRANLGKPAACEPGLHRRYSREGLAGLVRGAGFAIEKHLVLHALPALLPKRRPGGGSRGHSGGLAMRVPPAPVNTLLGLYVRAEDRIARLLPFPLPFGDAQIVLARSAP